MRSQIAVSVPNGRVEDFRLGADHLVEQVVHVHRDQRPGDRFVR